MAKIARSSLLFFLCFAVLLLSAVAWGQSQRRPGLVTDWTSTHLIFSGRSSSGTASIDPRALRSALVHGTSLATTSVSTTKTSKPGKVNTQVDWSVSLGAGNTAPNMFPAKFGFDPNATPDCTNDYVVYALNVPGTTGGQANLIAFNNLYSGAGTTFCNKTAPTVLFSYNVSTVGGSLLTSPIISFFGDKVFFVESTSTAAVFHRLTWKAGEGISATASAAPAFHCDLDLGPCTCPAGVSCDETLTINSTIGSTVSSPFPDYFSINDNIYVGTDDGTLYQIHGALYGTPTIGWTSPVSGGVLTGPGILFGGTGNQTEEAVYVGDDSGVLFKVDPATGTVLASVAVGGGFPDGGLVDAPIVDNGNLTVFAFSADDGLNGAVAVQADQNLGSVVRTVVGTSVLNGLTPAVNIHTGTFDNAYFSSPSSGFLYVCGVNDANTRPVLYQIGFAVSGAMNAASSGSSPLTNTAGVECSPLTEVFNSNITAHPDTLFIGLLGGCGTTGCVRDYNITNPPGTMPATFLNSVGEAGGTSGIIVDNVSPLPQASSIYFSTLGSSKRAVKLTQSQLN